VIVRRWNEVQSKFMTATERYVDYEGAVRAGKTTPLVWRIISYAVQYPGIKMMLTRWTDDSLEAILKPKFYEECPRELLGKHPSHSPGTAANGWNAKEQFQGFTNGSMVYLRAMKTSDDTSRYSKMSGLTLAVIGIDQPEEFPEDVYVALKARLSQPGFPQQMLLCPNPPAHGHWLANEFPDGSDPVNHPPIPGHRYILTSVYDNREILGEEYIQELERAYPVGSVLRRRFIDGKRGLTVMGQPVYGAVFSRYLHVQEVEYNPEFPVVESWDFGQKHPAVSWHQFTPWGHWNILGSWMGTRQFIDQSIPEVAALREDILPNLTTLRVCCDPAGDNTQGHGIRQTAVQILNQHLRLTYGPQVAAYSRADANRPEKREWAIQQTAGFMGRLIQGRPALVVHPRCETLIDGFEAGYVYDDRAVLQSSRLPNIRKPKKDGTYDHLQNTCEYAVLCYGPRTIENPADPRAKARTRTAQEDYDEDDMPRQVRGNRAGY
jgi:hypothetical protein